MRPGITVQHITLPQRRQGLVRSDVLGVIGLIPRQSWPEDASAGDFVELKLTRVVELWEHPLRDLFSAATQSAVAAFYENGGDTCHLFGVCHKGDRSGGADAVFGASLEPLLYRLRTEEDLALLIVPDTAYAPVESRGESLHCLAEPLWEELLAHCREMENRFLILDTPRGLHGKRLAAWFQAYRERAPGLKAYGAMYYPWMKRFDDFEPPSGAMAGVYARCERQHDPYGVVWPPANLTVKGATHLEVELDWSETAAIAETGLNPLVIQPGRGVVVWGARTLSMDPTWTHINSRRVVSMIREQLRRDNEWVVFEPNDENIWKVLERDVAVRLEEFWRAGLITGETRHGDYEVKCDEETNPLSEREAGRMNVRLSLRPIGTTEHISIDLRLGEQKE